MHPILVYNLVGQDIPNKKVTQKKTHTTSSPGLLVRGFDSVLFYAKKIKKIKPLAVRKPNAICESFSVRTISSFFGS